MKISKQFCYELVLKHGFVDVDISVTKLCYSYQNSMIPYWAELNYYKFLKGDWEPT